MQLDFRLKEVILKVAFKLHLGNVWFVTNNMEIGISFPDPISILLVCVMGYI